MTTVPIYGHRFQQEMLKRQIDENRLAHALCFAGPAGIGKRTVAQAAIAYDFCEQKPAILKGCGECTACKKLAGGNHPDSVLLEPESQNLKIDQVREIFQQVRFHPLYAKRRWVLIDAAQTLTEQAQNALLRTLEEPNAQTHFILIVDSFDRLLQTVRSRCQLVRFSTLSTEEITAVLKQLHVAAEHLNDLIVLSNGSPGRALELAQEELIALRREVLQSLRQLAFTPGGKDAALQLLLLSQELGGQKTFRPFILEMMLTFFRDLACAGAGVAQEQWINQDLLDNLSPVPLPALSPKAVTGYRLTRQLEQDFRVNVNPELAFNRLLFDLAGVFHGV